MHIYTHPHIHKSFSSNGLLLCDKRSGASSGPPTQQENQVMHLEMVRATDTNKLYVIKGWLLPRTLAHTSAKEKWG